MLFVVVWNSQFSEYLYYLVYGPQDDPGKLFNQHIAKCCVTKIIQKMWWIFLTSDDFNVYKWCTIRRGSGLIVDLV